MVVGNYKQLAKTNTDFRKVIHTGEYGQIVLMSLEPGQDIGTETHPSTDQLLLIVEGDGEATLDGKVQAIGKKDLLYIHAGTEHNITNSGSEEMKLLSIYCPPEHADGTIHETKSDAEAAKKTESGPTQHPMSGPHESSVPGA